MTSKERTLILAKMMTEGRIFTATKDPIKQEFKEDGTRVELAKLAETQSSNSVEQNPSIIKSNVAINSFKSMKEHLLNDSNVDSETIVNLTRIEEYLNSLLNKQIQKVTNQNNLI